MLSGWGDWGLLRLMSLVLSGDGFTAGLDGKNFRIWLSLCLEQSEATSGYSYKWLQGLEYS